MGTPMAPTYAHLVMGYFEILLFSQCTTIFSSRITDDIIKNYFRYLDDIFIIWKTEFGDFNIFFNLISSIHSDFKFTLTHNEHKLNFLDISVIKLGSIIHTDIYYKETDSKMYLHFYSNHPRHIKRNIPYCLANRICRIVSDPKILEFRLHELYINLHDLKYPKNLILDAINKAKINQFTVKEASSNQSVQPFVFDYNSKFLDLYNTHINPILRHINNSCFYNNPLHFVKSLRQPNSLMKILNSNTYYSVKTCDYKKCKTCTSIIPSKSFIKINNTHLYFNYNMNCRTSNVIYILICKKCNKYYVGETSLQLNLRINLHRQHINHTHYSILNVSNHLRECNLGFNVVPIFKLFVNSTYIRKNLENYFINILNPELNR